MCSLTSMWEAPASRSSVVNVSRIRSTHQPAQLVLVLPYGSTLLIGEVESSASSRPPSRSAIAHSRASGLAAGGGGLRRPRAVPGRPEASRAAARARSPSAYTERHSVRLRCRTSRSSAFPVGSGLGRPGAPAARSRTPSPGCPAAPTTGCRCRGPRPRRAPRPPARPRGCGAPAGPWSSASPAVVSSRGERCQSRYPDAGLGAAEPVVERRGWCDPAWRTGRRGRVSASAGRTSPRGAVGPGGGRQGRPPAAGAQRVVRRAGTVPTSPIRWRRPVEEPAEHVQPTSDVGLGDVDLEATAAVARDPPSAPASRRWMSKDSRRRRPDCECRLT